MLKKLLTANKEGSHWVLPIEPRRKNSLSYYRKKKMISSCEKKKKLTPKKRKIEEEEKTDIIVFSSPSYKKGGNTFLNRLISANHEGGYWTNLAKRGKRSRRHTLPKTPRREIRRQVQAEVTPRPSLQQQQKEKWTPVPKVLVPGKPSNKNSIDATKSKSMVQNTSIKSSKKLDVEASPKKTSPSKHLTFESSLPLLPTTKMPSQEFKTFMVKLFRHRDSCSIGTIVDTFLMSQKSSQSEVMSMLCDLQESNKFMIHGNVVYAI